MCVLQMSFSAKHWDGLLAILACSDGALRQVVQQWPGIADLTVADVMQRLMCLKVSMMQNVEMDGASALWCCQFPCMLAGSHLCLESLHSL